MTTTGRTTDKWISFRMGDATNTMREIPVDDISIVGIRYEEQPLTAFQDSVAGRLPMFPTAPIEFGGTLDSAAPAYPPTMSGSLPVLAPLAGNTTPRSLDIRFGMRSAATYDSPQFGITRSNRNGYMLTDFTIDPKSMTYKARAVLIPGSALPAWGNTAEGVRAVFAHTKAGVYYTENIYSAVPVWKSLNGGLSAAESAAIIAIAPHRFENRIFAVSPAYLLQADFVDGATSQDGLSVLMDADDLRAAIGYDPGDTVQFMSIGTHRTSGDALFIAGRTNTTRDRRFWHISPTGTRTAGIANSTNFDASPVLSWGGTEAICGTVGGSGSGGSGVLATGDYGQTWTYYPKRTTAGTYYRIARAGTSQSIGLVANETYAKTEYSTDNGHNISDGSSAYIPILETSSPYSWAANDDNSLGLATVKKISNSTYWLAYTTDGGATWHEIAQQSTIANAYRAFVHISGSVWMWGDDTKVYLSLNNGLSSSDVTGNLLLDFPGVGNVIDLRAIDFMA